MIMQPGVVQGRKVLLAEDNLINQTVAKKMLSQIGLSCTVAANGAEAVAAVTAPGAAFDVVLMDMAMPVMGGVSATKVRTPFLLSLPPRCSHLPSWYSMIAVHQKHFPSPFSSLLFDLVQLNYFDDLEKNNLVWHVNLCLIYVSCTVCFYENPIQLPGVGGVCVGSVIGLYLYV